MSILFLQGIPFSNQFWTPIIKRLNQQNFDCHTWNFLEVSGDIDSLVIKMQEICSQNNITTVVAHGLALPLAWRYCELYQIDNLIISNGLVEKSGLNHMILRSINTIPKLIANQLLRPMIALPLLASSAAFRRLVINPYVMDYDNIVLLCQEQLHNASIRQNMSQYLSYCDNFAINQKLLVHNLLAIWGDIDPLFPVKQIQNMQSPNAIQIKIIEGGAHFHPIERPWAMADIIATSLQI